MNGRRLVTALRFGVIAGLAIAGSVAAIVTAREWMINPGGIYHGADGIEWSIVLETAWSWFFPLFAAAAVLAAAVRWLTAGRR